MTLFDLVFLFLVLISFVTFGMAAYAAIRGRWAHAGSILRRWAVAAAIYMAVVIAVSLVKARRVVPVGEDLCYDDWCIGVSEVQKQVADRMITYDVAVRVSSRAKRWPQRENGVIVYLEDAAGGRHEAAMAPAAEPLTVLLQPGQAVVTHRIFQTAEDVRGVGMVVSHGAGPDPGWFIIGEGPPIFRRPPMVRFE